MASPASPEPDPGPNPWTADEPTAPTAPLLAPEPVPSPPTPPSVPSPPPSDKPQPPPPQDQSPPPPPPLNALLAAALRFLSTATPGHLAACLALLATLTYAVLG